MEKLEFKGTNGKWKDALTPMRKSKVVDYNGFSICTLSAGTPTDRANAKLIAAAPCLLEALQDALKYLPEGCNAHEKSIKTIHKALNG